jgi:hypothetical protein
MKANVAALFLSVAFSAAANEVEAPARCYPTDGAIALRWGSDLCEALPAQFGGHLAASPVQLMPGTATQIAPTFRTNGTKVLGQVSVSEGFIDLINHLAHAKAVDRIRPGFFREYLRNFTRITGTNSAATPPMIADARFWASDIITEQATYFNQMLGVILAIDLAHHYMGYTAKYAERIAGAGHKAVPVNEVLTPAEWEMSARAGAADALSCALSTDGARALFDAIARLPRRPAWTETIVPKGVDLKKLQKDLARYEKVFYHGVLQWPTPQTPVPGGLAAIPAQKPAPETVQSPPALSRRNPASND